MTTSATSRMVAAAVAAGLALGGCGSGDDDAAPAETTSTAPAPTSPSTTTEVTTSTAPSTTTTAPATTTTAAPTTTAEAPTTTTEPGDTTPPGAPSNVTCAAGGGSGEVWLEWDAPPETDGVVDVRVYVDEGGGFTRIEKFSTDAEALRDLGARWATVAFPIWPRNPVQVAVTHGDAAGNESGWNPIVVDYDYAPGYAGTCG